MSVDSLISAFKLLLNEEKEIYSKILGLSKKKRTSIMDNDIEALDDIVREEQSLIIMIGSVEDKRKEYTEKFARSFGFNPDTVKLKEIIDRCPETQKEELTVLHKELLAIVDEQIKLNEANELLVNSKLQYIDFILDMTTAQGQTGTYGSGGKENQEDNKRSKMIDFKV